MRSLPVDLIRPIFQRVQDRRTLLSLCLSSKILQPEAQKILYHSPLGRTASTIQHINFLTSLIHHPRLALLIKVYHVMLVSGNEKATFWQLLPSVLPWMSNLRVFSISALGRDIQRLPMEKLVFQLEVLSWIQVDGGDSGAFARWLDTQTALRELRYISRNPIAISPIACPNLIGLEGNFRVLTAFLPSRQIKRLYWTSDAMFKRDQLMPLLTELCSDLRFELLSIEKHLDPIDYRVLIDHLPTLTSLEYLGDGQEFTNDIPIPPNLRILILSIHKWAGKTTFPMTERPTLIQKLFAEHSNLSRVDIAAGFVGKELFYERWEHSSRMEDLISSQDVLQGHRIPSLV